MKAAKNRYPHSSADFISGGQFSPARAITGGISSGLPSKIAIPARCSYEAQKSGRIESARSNSERASSYLPTRLSSSPSESCGLA